MKIQNRIVFLLILFITITSCSKKIYQVAYPTLNDGSYDSEFPYKNCSQELAAISESVTKVFCNSFYNSYYFSVEKGITKNQIPQDLLQKSDGVTELKNTVAGTGTIIYYRDNHIAILTCAHVVTKPDTTISYYDSQISPGKNIIQTIAIKQKQDILVYGMPEGGDFETLLIDNQNDIAILSKELERPTDFKIPVLNYPFGRAKELQWGSFVYVIGYPMGYKIVTKGIVSQPDRDRKGAFLIDALFNRGLSGGILLAIRDGVPNFEVVGITTSAAAETETVLVPERDRDYDETVPYEGRIYVANKKSLTYGVTRAISAEAILGLIQENREMLLKRGYEYKLE